MNINNFMQNLAYIWQPQKLEKGFLSANNKSLGETLTIQDPATGKKINLAEQKTDKKNPWLIGKVDISKSAELLAKADKAMAELMQKSYEQATMNFKLSDLPILQSDFKKDKNLLKTEQISMTTGLKICEFAGSNADIKKVDLNKKTGFSISNIAKQSQTKISNENIGTLAIFEKVTYDYSYALDAQTKETKLIDVKRHIGEPFVAKKAEAKNNVLDLTGVEYVYIDIPNKKTNLPYRVASVKDLDFFDGWLDGVFYRLCTDKVQDIGNLEMEKEALEKMGVKPGEFTFIDSRGRETKFMITDNMQIVTLQGYKDMKKIIPEGKAITVDEYRKAQEMQN